MKYPRTIVMLDKNVIIRRVKSIERTKGRPPYRWKIKADDTGANEVFYCRWYRTIKSERLLSRLY